jgi:putative phosphoesterase
LVTIGVLSDTHVPSRLRALPDRLFSLFAGVDLILHAGDLDDSCIVDQLTSLAPILAVRGNMHFQALWPNDQELPLSLDFDVEGHRFLLTHGHLTLWNSLVEKLWMFLPDAQHRANRRMVRRLARVFPGVDVFVFGHSHLAMLERRSGTLFVNPGAVCPTRGMVPTVARLVVTPDTVEGEICRL